MLRFVSLFTIACALGVSTTSAEDYILRMEDLVYRDADLQSLKAHFAAGLVVDKPEVGSHHLKSEVAQTIEIQVRPGAPFYTRARIGDRTLTVSGELVPTNTAGQFRLQVDRLEWKSTEPSGNAPNGTNGQTPPPLVKTISLRPELEVGKTVALGPFVVVKAAAKTAFTAEKGTYLVHTLRLEAVDTAKRTNGPQVKTDR